MILTLCLLFLVSACNQPMLAGWYAMKNATVGTLENLRNIGSEDQYDRLSLATRAQRAPPDALKQMDFGSDFEIGPLSCTQRKDQEEVPRELLKSIADITAALPPLSCQCAPWGDCSKSVCACETLCPQDFNIFKRPGQKLNDLSAPENSLAFRNGEGGAKFESTNGYCWGHASLTSQFNRLATFKSTQKPEFDINSPDPQEQNQAISAYKKLIDQVAANKVSVIPGFQNLHEMSSHPALQSYIADHVATSWAQRAMSYQGLKVGLSSSNMERSQNEELIREISTRLEVHQQPQIVFTKKDSRFTTHAILIGDSYIGEDGKTYLCARDSNLSPKSNHNCENIIYVDEEGQLIYNQWGELGGAAIAHNDSTDTLVQRQALYEDCTNLKGCPLLSP